MRKVWGLFLGLLILVNATCAMVLEETISGIINGIASGSYDDVLKEYNFYPVLIECMKDTQSLSPRDIKSILWLKRDAASNENPYLVYTGTHSHQLCYFNKWEVNHSTMPGMRFCRAFAKTMNTLNVEEISTSKTQTFTSESSVICKEIECIKHGEGSFEKKDPKFGTCLCECLLSTLDLKQDLQIITFENVKLPLIALINLYQKKQRSNKRTSDSQPGMAKKRKLQYKMTCLPTSQTQ